MAKKNKHFEARNMREYSQECMAAHLKMDTSSYSRKENGMIKISGREWGILAEYLNVPLEDIYEPDESLIFIFNDNSTGNGNIVSNYTIPQSIWESQRKYIEKLEEENLLLKEEINRMKSTK